MILVRRRDDVCVLPLAAGTVERLAGLGIRTVGELFDAPREILETMGQPRKVVQLLAEGTTELGLVEWGARMDARTGKLWWSMDEDGKLTVWGKGRMPNYTGENLPPWRPWAGEIRSVWIQEEVTSIGARAFRDCERLEEVHLSEHVERIGTEAFSGCGSLTVVETPRRLLHWRQEGRDTSFVPKVFVGMRAFAHTPWQARQQEEFLIRDGVLMEYFGEAQDLVIPEGVREIEPMVFENLPIQSVKFPKSLERIGQFAFRGTQIRELTLPKNIRTVECWAFGQVKELERVTLGKSKMDIARDAFAETKIHGDVCRNVGKFPSLYSLSGTQAPGIWDCQRLEWKLGKRHRIGSLHRSSRSSFQMRLKRGDMVLRVCLDRENKLLDYVQAFFRDPKCGYITQLMYPCVEEDGSVGIWTDSTTYLDSDDIRRCNLEGLTKPGRYEWYVREYQSYDEYDKLWTLARDWLAAHPDYRTWTMDESQSDDVRYSRMFVPD